MKDQLRTEAKQLLSSLDTQVRVACQNQLGTQLADYFRSQGWQYIGLYMPDNFEINPWSVLAHYLAKYYIPKITDYTTKEMAFSLFETDALYTNRYGIQESRHDIIDTKRLDGIVVPLLRVDDSGVRLGHGAGYYDRFLAKTQVPTIGVGFAVQRVSQLPKDPWDVGLDEVILV